MGNNVSCAVLFLSIVYRSQYRQYCADNRMSLSQYLNIFTFCLVLLVYCLFNSLNSFRACDRMIGILGLRDDWSFNMLAFLKWAQSCVGLYTLPIPVPNCQRNVHKFHRCYTYKLCQGPGVKQFYLQSRRTIRIETKGLQYFWCDIILILSSYWCFINSQTNEILHLIFCEK